MADLTLRMLLFFVKLVNVCCNLLTYYSSYRAQLKAAEFSVSDILQLEEDADQVVKL